MIQLLSTAVTCYLFTKQNVEHEIDHDIDSAYRVCLH